MRQASDERCERDGAERRRQLRWGGRLVQQPTATGTAETGEAQAQTGAWLAAFAVVAAFRAAFVAAFEAAFGALWLPLLLLLRLGPEVKSRAEAGIV